MIVDGRDVRTLSIVDIPLYVTGDTATVALRGPDDAGPRRVHLVFRAADGSEREWVLSPVDAGRLGASLFEASHMASRMGW